ncbi:MAG: response regulator [Myxococcales bacterium]
MSSSAVSVLVVDDEPAIRDTTAALLEDDYVVEQSANAREALKLLGSRRFDVICTDYRMPGMTGVDLLRAAQRMYPGITGIVVTAYADYPEHQSSFREVPCLVLLKPYEPQQLHSMVARSAKLSRMKQVSHEAAVESQRLATRVQKK